MNQRKRIVESTLLLAIFTVMLFITAYIPVIGLIVMLVLPVPFIIISSTYTLSWSGLCLGAAIFLTGILSLSMLPVTIIYAVIGLVIGTYIRLDKSRLEMFILSVLVFIAGTLGSYLLFYIIFEVNIIAEFKQVVDNSIEQVMALMNAAGQPDVAKVQDSFRQTADLLETLLPSILVITSIVITALVFVMCKPFINRFCQQKFMIAPVRDIQLPKSLLWYYLIIMIASLFIQTGEGEFLYTAMLNLLFCIQFFLLLQGISFVFFFSHAKNWSKAVPVMIVVASFILPLASVIRILGIIDLGFDLRGKLSRTS
ncbi:MAG: YybS family protein [Bacillus sp. (in: firmicutes)]